jgi:hypothetical protein
MNRADIARAGFTTHQRVTVQGEAGELQNVEIIPGEIRSGTPAFKRVPVLVRAGRGAVAEGGGGANPMTERIYAIRTIKELLGHNVIKTTMTYTHAPSREVISIQMLQIFPFS